MAALARRTLLVLLILGLAPLPAPAKTVQFPVKGYPALHFVLPDSWKTKTGDEGQSFTTANAGYTALLAVTFEAATGPLEDWAKANFEPVKAGRYQRMQPASISGCKGFTWSGTTPDTGHALKYELTIVRVDDKQVAVCYLTLEPSITKTDESAAHNVLSGLKLIRGK